MNEEGSVKIYIPEEYKKLGVSLSGGADSAFMTYLLFQHITTYKLNKEIYFISSIISSKGKWKIFYIEEIIDFIEEVFPYVNIVEKNIFYVDDIKQLWDYQKTIIKNKKVDLILNATTKNPPYEDLIKYDMLRDRLTDRDEKIRDEWRNELGGIVYKPFINLNKKFIAKGFNDYDLMKSLYLKTISCEKKLGANNFNEDPCKKCWWCREKKWAFGVYDNGIE
jgi:hypothetical protein